VGKAQPSSEEYPEIIRRIVSEDSFGSGRVCARRLLTTSTGLILDIDKWTALRAFFPGSV